MFLRTPNAFRGSAGRGARAIAVPWVPTVAVARAECCMATPKAWLGANLTLPGDMRPDALLFGESASCIVMSVRPEYAEELRAIAWRHDVPCAELGLVGGDHLTLQGRGFSLYLPVETIHWAWSTGLSRSLK